MIRVSVIGEEVVIARFVKAAAASEVAVEAGEVVGANAVLASASSRVPVDTGALQASLGISEEDDAHLVGTDLRYAPFVEYGTSDTPAQPFLRPAADDGSEVFLSAIALAIDKALG